MLRISDSATATADGAPPHYLCIDKKKRQITLTDPTTVSTNTAATQERSPMVAAPKIFAFDNLFTHDDAQTDVCSSALSEVIPAVLEGTDGCLLTLGYPNAGSFYNTIHHLFSFMENQWGKNEENSFASQMTLFSRTSNAIESGENQ